ncbi:hypothetical protein F5148DRAFT_830899 [Russula earlei]|uniref:Uncharacterized protein n=1 Tax=Russula earlei TaxID=71964 RepID=A0ACC0UCR0_9AGAM|nr:hypothetical protein F5148DRAFT_830899 [Russula earlei]
MKALSPHAVSSVFLEDSSPATVSSLCKGTGPKKIAIKTCPFPACLQRCGRPQELERHIRKHLPRCMFCDQPKCNWTGSRRYALMNHFKKKHACVPIPGQDFEKFIIYDAKRLVKQLLNEEISVERAMSRARSAFCDRAVQLGKLGSWRK